MRILIDLSDEFIDAINEEAVRQGYAKPSMEQLEKALPFFAEGIVELEIMDGDSLFDMVEWLADRLGLKKEKEEE